MKSADEIKWNEHGLVAAIAQDEVSGEVLMMAWMNVTALEHSVKSGYATYWSRSRQKLWRKGEQSGHQQKISNIYLDCDGDVILLKVQQIGGISCHTGRQSCFYRRLVADKWQVVADVIKDPAEIYG